MPTAHIEEFYNDTLKVIATDKYQVEDLIDEIHMEDFSNDGDFYNDEEELREFEIKWIRLSNNQSDCNGSEFKVFEVKIVFALPI